MGFKFRYTFGKVLGTQDHLTLRLASHHCLLCLNFIKNMFDTCIYTHTHTSIHLSIYGIIHPKTHTYLPLNKRKPTQTHMRNPSMWNPIIHLKQGSNPNMAIIRSYKHSYSRSISHKHVHHKRCMFISMHDLPLLILQQLRTYDINAWTYEWMALKLRNPNLNIWLQINKQTCKTKNLEA